MADLRWGRLFAAVFLGVLAGIAAWYLLVKLYPVLLLAGIAFAIAYLFDPLLDSLERRGWSRGWAVAAVAAALVLLVAVAGLILVPLLVAQISTVVANWPAYSQQVQGLLDIERLSQFLERYFPKEQITPYLEEQIQKAESWLTAQLPRLVTWVSTVLLRSATTAGYVLLTLIMALYFMMVIDPFRRTFGALFPAGERRQLASVDRKVTHMLGQYLRGMALTCLGVGLVDTALLRVVGWSFGTQFSLLLGALAAVAYLVPYLGMLTASVTTGLLAYLTAQHHQWLAVGLSVGIILGVNQVFDSFLMPRIIGRKVGLHPLVVILALLSGGALLGIPGMIIATPIAATLKIILAQWVPVIATVPEVPEEKQPLVLDLGAFLTRTWGILRAAGQRLESAILPATTSAPAPPRQTQPDEEAAHEDAKT